MKAVIVEDEIIAAQNLQRLIQQVDNSIEIVAVLKSVEECIEWFTFQPMPDLVFMDIHLSDGSSFSIFSKTSIGCPIIFTTAYDQYALNAFEVNSIDYLLKPINKKDLERAITKYRNLSTSKNLDSEMLAELADMIKNKKSGYKSRFLIPYKDKFLTLDISEIAYIYSENKTARMVSMNDKAYQMNSSLDEVFKQLDPLLFFRANRQFIISRNVVKDIFSWFDGKLYITLSVPTPEKIIISRARVQDFKAWYTD
ncbi:MAG: LytTR family DNA-binding domain-containing protein [Bacteroidales bacterium]|jgi:two-component system LytT family response regulator|nr:LytTR family DNA-binding domain-containing protein [Bacteroidales bacterium]